MATEQKTIVRSESGGNCTYAVRDTDDNTILASVQTHPRHKHSQDVTYDDLRPLMRDACASEREQ